ncbi:hypothetical protein N657DRAFT_671293 [Parathielavia appendiculata]|uniref:Mediator of RNA polymerase II transcription subunit 9 n=1 Tax=Parathielavia appendiculata TaxID=2587402 RepID=A0AAN6U159_9PEZI|nr:hypothetical protein N657DRAFT_671293 [Parathielavia appendiculata]
MATHLPPGLSPDSVDAVTELSAIIPHLRSAAGASTTTNATAGPTSTTTTGPLAGLAVANSSSSSQLTTTPAAGGGGGSVTAITPLPATTTATSNPNRNSNTSGGENQLLITAKLLTPKDLPTATDSVKHKLQRARAAVRTLADMHRSIAAQEAEMGVLEGKRREQARRLVRTQEDGLVFVRRGSGVDEEEEAVGNPDRMVE